MTTTTPTTNPTANPPTTTTTTTTTPGPSPSPSGHSPSPSGHSPSPSGHSPLYTHLHHLALSHALPISVAHILSLRAPTAVHAWGHAHLVRRNPVGLGERMDNAGFAAHLASTGRYVSSPKPADVHGVVVDEWRREAVVVMSYYLCAKGNEEVVENEVVWTLKFSEEESVEEVRIVESVEYIDASASARLGTLVREGNGGVVGEDVRGGITLKE